MESPDLLAFVRDSLKAAGPKTWKGIADETGVSEFTIRKIAYGDRKNPTLETLQPLVTYFREDRLS